MAQTSGFNDPTAQRLERVTTGADPDIVGPLLADVLHDLRWLRCDVALVSGGHPRPMPSFPQDEITRIFATDAPPHPGPLPLRGRGDRGA